MSSRLLAVVGMAAALCAAAPAPATVFHTRSEALDLAFPEADRVEDHTYVLDAEQARRIEELAGASLDSRLVRVYRGYRDGDLLGYAFIDVHTVRTLPEAFLVVLSPRGEVESLRLLAFHEPLDYKPTERWYDQFGRKSLGDGLRVGRDIHGIVGATLSARATTRGVRRALALYEVVIQNGRH